MVRAIYADRSFQVRDSGRMSDVHAQRFGILQGCPLSPFLFSILMTVLIRDAKDKLHEQFGADRFGALGLGEILYADDTLLMGCDDEVLQAYMQHISDCGAEYGLSFNGTKLESMVVNCTADLVNTAGDVIPQKPALKYLGALLSSEGCDTSEISRRIGMARHELDLLKKCWSHTSLSKARKYDIYRSIVLSKLLYGLESATLHAHDKRKLDGFHADCCRKILRISSSHISRVSNRYVLMQLGTTSLTSILLKRQLQFFGSIARRAHNDPIRNLLFQPAAYTQAKSVATRKRGRPRLEWNTVVHNHAIEVAKPRAIASIICNKVDWHKAVNAYCDRYTCAYVFR